MSERYIYRPRAGNGIVMNFWQDLRSWHSKLFKWGYNIHFEYSVYMNNPNVLNIIQYIWTVCIYECLRPFGNGEVFSTFEQSSNILEYWNPHWSSEVCLVNWRAGLRPASFPSENSFYVVYKSGLSLVIWLDIIQKFEHM